MSGDSRVVLHIGLVGAGGAYLRSTMHEHRDALSAAGVQVYSADDEAVQDAVTLQQPGASSGAWQRLVAELTSAEQSVTLMSADLLSTAPDRAAKAIAASLAPRRVEIVVTAQDMARTLPSAWQHAVLNGRKLTFAEYAAAAVGAANDRPTREQLAKQQDLLAVLRRWSGLVGKANVHLVTVPPPDSAPGVLWQRFAQAIGAVDAVPAPQVAPYTDGQLAFSEAELLRRLNRRIGSEFGPANYDRYVRDFLAVEVMQPLGEAAAGDRPALDASGLDWATKRGRQLTADIAALGIDVVGDLEDLVPAPAARLDGRAGSTPLATYPDTAVRAVAMLVRRLVEIDPAAAPSLAKPAQQRRRLRMAGRNPRRAES